MSQIYSHSNRPTQLHDYMNKCFYQKLSDDDDLHGILTGFHSTDAIFFFDTYLPLNILDKMKKAPASFVNTSEEDRFYKEMLMNSFEYVERNYVLQNEANLTRKAVIDFQLNEGDDQCNNELLDERKKLEDLLSSGISACIMLIHKNRLHMANIGNTRLILAKQMLTNDGSYVITDVELSHKHDLSNLAERERLIQIGIDPNQIEDDSQLTRCLGNLWIKQFYNENPNWKTKSDKYCPVLSEPSFESYSIDHHCEFIVLASNSVFVAIKECLLDQDGTDQDAKKLFVKIIADAFQETNTNEKSDHTKNIAQSVVDIIAKKHKQCFDDNLKVKKCRQIEDITVSVRDLTKLKQLIKTNNSCPIVDVSKSMDELNLKTIQGYPEDENKDDLKTLKYDPRMISNQGEMNGTNTSSNNSSNSDEIIAEPTEIEAYVDFSSYYELLNQPVD